MATQSKTFCPLPFMHSHHSVAGKYKPCCNSDSPGHKGNVYTSRQLSLEEWFDSEPMQQLRKDLLSGVQNPVCDVCWKQEETGGRSYRQSMIERLQREQGFEPSFIKKPKITYLDLKFSNECNFACRMCDYTNSHQIKKDMDALDDLGLPNPIHWDRSPTQESLWDPQTGIFSSINLDQVLSLLPDLRILKVTGGEPMISKPFLRVLDEAINNGYAKNIILHVTTNASKFNDKVMNKILQFKKIYFTVSCDGYGSTYDYIRYPYSWSLFEKRIIGFLEQHHNNFDHVRLSFSLVPQMYNIENIDKFLKWANDLDKKYYGDKKMLTAHVQTHLYPLDSDLQFHNMPIDLLKQCYDNIASELDQADASFLNLLEHKIKNHKDPTEEKLKLIKQTTMNIDKVRKQNYQNFLEPRTIGWLNQI
jgi:organic radical activating enzyme